MSSVSAVLIWAWLISPPAGAAPCPNEALRTGPSAGLPDCRAYELVSPPETNGRLLEPMSGFNFEPARDLFPTELVSPSRDSIVYETYTSPLLTPSGGNGNYDLYEAVHGASGWTTVRRLTPSGEQAVLPTLGGVSSDHSYTFVHVEPIFINRIGGSLAGEIGADYLGNPDGSFELVGKGSEGEEPLAQGRYISPGGKHVIFSTGKDPNLSYWCYKQGPHCEVEELEPNAATGVGAIYDREADGPTHVVSLLPGASKQEAGQEAFYQGASENGTSIAFKINGTLYVRVHSGGGAEEETLEAAPAADEPVYAGLSEDGRYLFWVEGGEKGVIHRLDTGEEEDEEVNPADEAELVNVSADGSHAYFISEEEIGGQGEAGKPNLFAWKEAEAPQLAATVAPSDLVQTSKGPQAPNLEGIPALTRWTSQAVAPVNAIELGPGADSSRTTPNGKVIVFESKAELTGYENNGHTEVYRWEEGGGPVQCVSCLGAAEPAEHDARLQELELVGAGMVIHNLSDDGSKVFFESEEALTASDTDATNDVYEWQEEELGPRVDLISSGHSKEYPLAHESKGLPISNVLYSVTPDAKDVLFSAQEALVPGAGEFGTQALYDARVEGGFAEPVAPRACVEEECKTQSPGAGPGALSGEKSSTTQGKGNLKPKKKHRCHKKKCAGHHGKKHKGAGKRAARLSAQGSAPSSVPSASSAPSARPAAEPAAGSNAPSPRALIGDFDEFGIESLSATLSTAAAGQHPDFTTSFSLNHTHTEGGEPWSDAHAEEISVSLPPGLLGNPNAVAKCEMGEFVAFADCPPESQVGVGRVLVNDFAEITEPIYNLTPPHPKAEVARFGFFAVLVPVFIDVKVRTDSDYGVTATVHSPPSLSGVLASETIFWGNPSDSSHDKLRLTATEALTCETVCPAEGGERSIEPTDKAFFTNPAACQSGNLGLSVTSYQLPGRVFSKEAPLPDITDCQGLPFAPGFEATPTTHKAGAATGLNTKLTLPQHLGASEPATATMREARVTLPAGMGVNPGAANWIQTCSDAQVGYQHEVDAACPDGSKLGTAVIKSPALSEPVEGALYQRAPRPGNQLGLWLVADALGLHVKIPGELVPDNKAGRVSAIFRDLPQVPAEEIDLNVWGGPRAPLTNPASCGTYNTTFSFAPHSNDPAVAGSAPMVINEGCNQPFDPKLKAGTTNPVAGKFSPLVVDLERGDGEQALRGFELKLPDGLLAKIKGVGRCTEAQAAAGACPADSKLGSVIASAGPGADPLWVPQPGRAQPGVYLGGPHQGSPLSVITLVPAQAGPFDLGTLVVHSGLGLDPGTNRPVVKADPLPQFFEGAELTYRKLHVTVDRPKFTLNPTDCSVQKVESDVASTAGTVAHPSTRFKVNGCKALKFKPKLSLKLKGGTKRSDYPALTATLKARKGDANIGRAQVSLPHSEFLAQEHIVTICTRKQFAAGKCPKGSVYGYAEATTPLLAKPLKGPVYLRSSSHPLPDLVAALQGELDVNLVGRIDSHNGGIRTTFASVPDAPVTKFVLRMKGGAKGLLVNSTDVCLKPHRAQADFTAQNGRVANLRPKLEFGGCGGGGGKKGKGH